MTVEIQIKWVGKKAFYIRDIYFSNEPTDLDQVGCHGLYVKDVQFHWWMEPVFDLIDLYDAIKKLILFIKMIIPGLIIEIKTRMICINPAAKKNIEKTRIHLGLLSLFLNFCIVKLKARSKHSNMMT